MNYGTGLGSKLSDTDGKPPSPPIARLIEKDPGYQLAAMPALAAAQLILAERAVVDGGGVTHGGDGML